MEFPAGVFLCRTDYGPTSAATIRCSWDAGRTVSSGGGNAVIEIAIWELTDSAIPLEDLSRRLFREFEWVRDLSSMTKAAAALDSILNAFAERACIDYDPVSYAVSNLERTDGLISIREIADHIGWSTRQLQRRCKDTVGISPKLFGRMQRFQGVFRTMEDAASEWVNAAVRCGYYDQAHLIRDFREFPGKTPTALLDQEIDLSRRFVQPRRMSHFSKTEEGRSR